jgi:multiple sugar transport system substrate-binding protein
VPGKNTIKEFDMKKSVLLAVLFVLISAVLFAGGGNQAASNNKPIIAIQMFGSADRDVLIRKIIGDSYPGLEIEFIDVPTTEFPNKVAMMCQAKQDLDIIWEGSTLNLEWINNKFIMQLDDFAASWADWATVADTYKNIVKSYDGHIWAIPLGGYQRILFYRTDYLRDAGYNHPPATWQEVFDMSKVIHQKNPARYGYTFRPNAGYYAQTVTPFLPPEVVNPASIFITLEGKSIFEYPEILEATKFFKQLYTEASPPESMNYTPFQNMVEAFYSGVTTFMLQDSDTIPICEQYMENGTWMTTVLPKGPHGYDFYKIGSTSINIAAHSKNVENAYNVIRAVCGPKGNMEYSRFYGTYPVQTASATDPYFGTGYYKAYGETLLDSKRIGYIENSYPAQTTMEEIDYMNSLGIDQDAEVQRYLMGEITAEDLIATYKKLYAWVEASSWVKATYKK